MAEKRTNAQIIQGLLERWQLWKKLYSPDYIERFFHLYDAEYPAVMEALQSTGVSPAPALQRKVAERLAVIYVSTNPNKKPSDAEIQSCMLAAKSVLSVINDQHPYGECAAWLNGGICSTCQDLHDVHGWHSPEAPDFNRD